MDTIIREYGGVLLAAVGAFTMMAILGHFFADSEGALAQLIQFWGNGGF